MNGEEKAINLFDWKNWLHLLGPVGIVATFIFGLSKITITSVLGAHYGYELLQLLVVIIFFMVVFTNVFARIGVSTNQSLLGSIQQKWEKTAGILVGIDKGKKIKRDRVVLLRQDIDALPVTEKIEKLSSRLMAYLTAKNL